MQKRVIGYMVLLAAVMMLTFGCSGGGNTSPAGSSVSATWFVPEGTILDGAQTVNLLDSGQLYFDVQSATNIAGEIRGGVVPLATFQTDGGDPFATNPANNPVTFAALLGGDQIRPRNVVTNGNGYGSITFDPLSKNLTGFIVTSGISGKAAQIHDGLAGTSGATIVTLEGGPVVWMVPANTVLTNAQVARLFAGALYFSVDSDTFPAGEIRGQLDQQVRCASLSGTSVVPPVNTNTTGVGFLALKKSTNHFSGFVKVTGTSASISSVTLRSAPSGSNGPAIVVLVSRGGGVWSLPANTVLSDPQVADFNAGNLYFNVNTDAHPAGELRGQLLQSAVRVATADLNGGKVVPPVSTPATGAGMIAVNPTTGQISGSVKTSNVVGTLAQLHSGPAAANGPSLANLTTTSPVTVAPTPGISFALDIQPIFNANCAVSPCHVTGGLAPVSFEPAVSYTNVSFLIVPENSASSYLVSRLTGAFPPQMPLNRAPLSSSSLDLIKAWIDRGALNN